MTQDAKILVTGATGFVGSAVARALAARGHALRLLVRRGSDRRNIAGLEAELAEGDLTDAASLARAVAGCADLVHVAADYRLWVPNPAAMMAANVAGTRSLMLAAAEAGVRRMVHCSSVAALGLTGTDEPANEATPVHEDKIVSTYKLSKYHAEKAVLALVREQGLPIVIVNPSMPVGPRDIKPTPTGRLVRDAAAGRIPAFVDTGMNVVHVDDVAEGHCLALERGVPGERYILGGENLSMRALLAMIAEVSGKRAPRIGLPVGPLMPLAYVSELWGRVSGHEPIFTTDALRMARKKMWFSSAKAMAELGYRPRPVREGVVEALAWFRATGALPK